MKCLKYKHSTSNWWWCTNSSLTPLAAWVHSVEFHTVPSHIRSQLCRSFAQPGVNVWCQNQRFQVSQHSGPQSVRAGFLKWTYICIGWLRRAHRPGGVGLVNKVHHLWGERREARPSHSDRDCHKCTKEGQRTHSASQVTATLLYTPRLQYKYFTSEKGEAAVVHGFLQYLWYNLTAGSCFYFQKH